jgi:hypothetical protein
LPRCEPNITCIPDQHVGVNKFPTQKIYGISSEATRESLWGCWNNVECEDVKCVELMAHLHKNQLSLQLDRRPPKMIPRDNDWAWKDTRAKAHVALSKENTRLVKN